MIAGVGELVEAEAAALVSVMSVSELVDTLARVEHKQRQDNSTASEQKKTPPPGGLTPAEADALVCALGNDELERTITRVGLDASDVVGDVRRLRVRASIALMHPMPALPQTAREGRGGDGSGAAAAREAELKARLDALEQLYAEEDEEDGASTRIQAIWRGHHQRAPPPLKGEEPPEPRPQQPSEDDPSSTSPEEPLTFGGVAFSPEMLDEFMLTPGEFEDRVDSEEWADQLLLLFNDDRRAHGLPELEPWGEEEEEEASGEPSAAGGMEAAAAPQGGATAPPPAALADGAGAPPSLDRMVASSAWLLWEVEETGDKGERRLPQRLASCKKLAMASKAKLLPAQDAAVVDGAEAGEAPTALPADVQTFLDGLSEEAREHLEKLYRLGALKPDDPVSRQQRYVKAVGNATGNKKAGFQ
jgi:hypothetical protein